MVEVLQRSRVGNGINHKVGKTHLEMQSRVEKSLIENAVFCSQFSAQSQQEGQFLLVVLPEERGVDYLSNEVVAKRDVNCVEMWIRVEFKSYVFTEQINFS